MVNRIYVDFQVALKMFYRILLNFFFASLNRIYSLTKWLRELYFFIYYRSNKFSNLNIAFQIMSNFLLRQIGMYVFGIFPWYLSVYFLFAVRAKCTLLLFIHSHTYFYCFVVVWINRALKVIVFLYLWWLKLQQILQEYPTTRSLKFARQKLVFGNSYICIVRCIYECIFLL